MHTMYAGGAGLGELAGGEELPGPGGSGGEIHHSGNQQLNDLFPELGR